MSDKKNNDDIIVEKMEKDYGKVPTAIKLMAKRQGAVTNFMNYRNQVLEGGPLSNKEKFLIALGVTVALKSEHCIPVQAKNAKKNGASEEEIVQTMLIAGLVSGNSPLNVAYKAYFAI